MLIPCRAILYTWRMSEPHHTPPPPTTTLTIKTSLLIFLTWLLNSLTELYLLHNLWPSPEWEVCQEHWPFTCMLLLLLQVQAPTQSGRPHYCWLAMGTMALMHWRCYFTQLTVNMWAVCIFTQTPQPMTDNQYAKEQDQYIRMYK